MVFQPKYPKDYWKLVSIVESWFKPISKREIKAIIKKFNQKPYPERPFPHIRVIYDETTESYNPRSSHKSRGNITYQIAIYENILIIRKLNKHIKYLNKEDLESFRLIVSKILRNTVVFITDKRFSRLKLDNKYYEVFNSIHEHNLIHRIIANTKNYVYNRKYEYSKAWLETAKVYKLKLVVVNN